MVLLWCRQIGLCALSAVEGVLLKHNVKLTSRVLLDQLLRRDVRSCRAWWYVKKGKEFVLVIEVDVVQVGDLGEDAAID